MKPRTIALVDILVCAELPKAPVPGEDGALPEWIHVAPKGKWKGHPSGPVDIDSVRLAQMVDNAKADGIDVVVDWEHQTLYKEFNGQPAPAAGWLIFDDFEIRDDGLWAHVRDWTPRAAQQLRDREYRFLSPVIVWAHADRETGENRGAWLHSVALTNRPFFAGHLDPVVASEPTSPTAPHGDSMNVMLLALLGLAASATDAAVEGAVNDLNGRADKARKKLGLDDDATLTDILAASSERAPLAELGAAASDKLGWKEGELPADAKDRLETALDHKGYVAMSDHLEAIGKVDREKTALTDDQVVEQAKREGRLTPAQEAGFRTWLASDRPAALAFLRKQTSQVPVRSPFTEGTPDTEDDDDLDATALSVCSQLGLTPEQFKAAQTAQSRITGGAQ